MNKEEARQQIKAVKKTLSTDMVAQKSRSVINQLYQCSEFLEAQTILTYVSYNQEVMTHDLIRNCLADGKVVLVPKVYGKEMHFHRILQFEDLKPGKYGILEPDHGAIQDVTEGFMIMPGLAFDPQFHRIGYGGGFYDRYLALHPAIRKAAVCFDFQLLPQLETESFDLKPDMIITEHAILRA